MKIFTKLGGVVTKLGIGCIVCLFLGAAVLLYAQERTRPGVIGTSSEGDDAQMPEMAAARMPRMNTAPGEAQPQRNSAWGRQNRGGGVDFGENKAFYKTIIDNDLFRPLGWMPPNNEPSYRLEGTAVNQNGVISQATLLELRSNRYHFVTIGTELDGMTVKDIQAKQIILDKEGETVTFRTGSLQLLTAKRENESNRGGGRSEGGSETARNNTGQNRANQANAEQRGQTGRGDQGADQQARRREMMERMRNASPEQRRELIQQFRRRGGGGDGGRRGRGRDR